LVRIGIALDYSGGFHQAVDRVVELEKAGIDVAVVAEAYSFDAVSQLGYLAAKTNTVELASGVFPIYIRTPSLLAMTAAGLDFVSDGRFRLGKKLRPQRLRASRVAGGQLDRGRGARLAGPGNVAQRGDREARRLERQ